jgi:hypothetical protein
MGLERQLSAEGRAYLAALREDIENFKKKMPLNILTSMALRIR